MFGCYNYLVTPNPKSLRAALIALLFLLPTAVLAQTTPTPVLIAEPLPTPLCTITATPSTITVGASTQVRWTSTNATEGSITHIGQVSPQGAVNLAPSFAAQTVFTGTFTGPGGTATCQATVVVSARTNTNTGGNGLTTYGPGGTYEPGGGDGVFVEQGDFIGTYDTGGTYTPGGTYSPGNTYQPTGYSINPSSFTTQPTNNSFSQTPSTVSSGNTGGSTGGSLVPCGTILANGQSYYDNATSCNICSLGQLSQNIINFLIMLAIPLSAAMFAWGGFLYYTAAAKPAQIAQAHKIFSSVLIGFAIALSGYLIVQTVLNAFLNDSYKTGQFSLTKVNCDALTRERHSTIGQIFTNIFVPNGSNPTSGSGLNTGGGTPSQVGGAPGSGQLIYAPNISSSGVNPDLMNPVMNSVSLASAGQVTVTSATRAGSGNSLHSTGDALDIGYNNTQFNNWIAQNGTQQPQNYVAPGSPAYMVNGVIWSYEPSTQRGSTGNHWHVSKNGH